MHALPCMKRTLLALALAATLPALAQTFDRRETAPYTSTKSKFSFEFKGVQPGGEVKWEVAEGGTQEIVRDEYVILQGGVKISYGDVVMKADKITYNFKTQDATAEGNVIIDQGPQRLSAERAAYNLGTQTGTLFNGRASMEPSVHFRGETIEKLDDDTYRLTNGIFTSCDIDDPDWSFHVGSATITVEDYAQLEDLSFRAGGVPLFYSPYLVWPTKTDRSRGFLVPKPGYNSDFGAYLKTAYFVPFGDSADATVLVDGFSEGVVGTGLEVRYIPTRNMKGAFNGSIVFNGSGGLEDIFRGNDIQWRYDYKHTQENLPGGFRGVIDVRDFSDLDFFQDYERDFSLNTLSNIYSAAYLTKNRPTYSLNIRTDRREHFLGRVTLPDGRTFQQSKLFDQIPAIEYRTYPNRVGSSPFYYSMESSASHLRTINNTGFGNPEITSDYYRADLFPTLTMQVRTPPWLAIKPRVSARGTFYTASLCDSLADPACTILNPIVEDELTRTYAQAEVEMVGPSLSRIFDGTVGGFSRFKHVIEPRVRYLYTSEVVEEQLRVIRFDTVDSPSLPLVQDLVEYALVQRLIGKERGEAGVARDLMSLTFRQSVSLGKPFSERQPQSGNGQKFTPLTVEIHVNPYQRMVIDASLIYGNVSRQLDQSSLAATVAGRNSYLNLTWFTQYESKELPFESNQIRFGTGAPIVPNRLRADVQVNYDIERDQLLEQRYVLSYFASCYNVALEFRDFIQFQGGSNPDHNRDYQLSISLKNVGTFLDFRGSLDNIF